MSEEVLVSVQEARRRLGGIGNAKLYALLRADLIVARRLGGRTLIEAASLAALPERLERVTLPDGPRPNSTNLTNLK